MASGQHHVYIIQPSKGKFLVRPAVASADRQHGDKKLHIRNTTEYDADIKFPGAGIADVTVENGECKPVDIEKANSGFFTYEVTMKNTPYGDVPAEGESAPGLILDP